MMHREGLFQIQTSKGKKQFLRVLNGVGQFIRYYNFISERMDSWQELNPQPKFSVGQVVSRK